MPSRERRWDLAGANPVTDGIQGLLPDARGRQDGDGQGDQAGVPQACQQVPSRRQPWRQDRRGASSRRSTRRTRCSAIADKRRKYDELGANWRMYEQAQQQGQGFPGGSPYGFGGGAQDAWTINMGGPGGGYRTMTARGDAGPLRQRGSVLGLLPHVLRRRRPRNGGPGARRPGAPGRRRARTSSRTSS